MLHIIQESSKNRLNPFWANTGESSLSFSIAMYFCSVDIILLL